MGLLRYRPPLVTYRVVKARRMTAYQAQYLARKSRQLGRSYDEGSDDSGFIEPMRWRALQIVGFVGIAAATLILLALLAPLTWFTVELVAAIIGAFF
jgi:hypothetical protein